ncbi:hypothetical protein WS89_31245 [Burkholderia sp. MSMB1072]|uniref:hypothetical protein n=1 Tax=Burkholderia sp. MSMB1072 TaxID=1637871 RepID=UPI00076D30C7|nr:hypothetical protein [Burkholderia sp. MSMB1072]KVH52914.1 hypothetical protein WS89_31245 [Burkholderia sp. MSMB1072]
MITWKQFCEAVLGASPAAVYTSPASTAAAIHQATAWNPTGSVVTVKLYIVPAAGSATDATTIWSTNVPAGSPAQIPQIIGHKLQAGQQLFASGNGVTLTISGAENVQQ